MSERLPARTRALATELQALRTRSGLSTREAAKLVGMSPATLNRCETAKRSPTVLEVGGMLAIYGAAPAERERVLDLMEEAQPTGWLELGDRWPRLMTSLVNFEAQATAIVSYAADVIPGLLQVPGYARAMFADGGHDKQTEDRMVETRMGRQRILAKPHNFRYLAILDESTLRRPFGGSVVMAAQVRWLIEMAKVPAVTIRVIPFKHGGYQMPGQFMMFDFPKASTLVSIEHEGVAGFLDDPEVTDVLRMRVEKLMGIALDSTDTVNFLRAMVADYERG